MNITKKAAHYLREAHIDFTSFYILDIAVQNEKHAAVLLALIDRARDRYFCIQYMGNSYFYGSIEQMMNICVETEYLTRREADRLISDYYGNMTMEE